MAEITLNDGQIALVDDADYDLVAGRSWCSMKHKNAHTWYAVTTWVKPCGKRTTMMMHRLVMSAGPGTRIDHVNGNGLDNRRSNLRFCTHMQNIQNIGPRPKTAAIHSRFKGVRFESRSKRNPWLASIKANRVTFDLGCYPTEEAAAKAYDMAARKLHGEFARLNFPDIVEV